MDKYVYLIPWDKWHLSHSFEWNKELHYRTHFITPLSGISELHYPTQWDKEVIIPLSGVMKLAEINKIYLFF
jgi:hypothetical protein